MSVTSRTGEWIAIRKRQAQAKLRLFCFSYAGGGAWIYQSWPDNFPEAIEVCAIQLPGRGRRLHEPPFTRLPDLIEALGPAIKPYLDKPFAFFGHSMGAVTGFELCRRLIREGEPGPVCMFVSGFRAPHLPDRDAPTYHLGDAEFLDDVRRLNGTPQEVLDNPELLNLILPFLRADFEIVQTYEYTPGPRLSCPLTVLGGLSDNDVSRQDLEAWKDYTESEFNLHMFPGDHFFVNSAQPYVISVVARQLCRLID